LVNCLFDKENINYAFGFYTVDSLLTEQSLQAIKQIEQQYPGRIVPFFLSIPIPFLTLEPKKIEEIVNSNKDLFKGYGEIGFYRPEMEDQRPDDPYFLEMYGIADKHNLIVMIHPAPDNQQAIKQIVQDNPNVIFLFHGGDFAEGGDTEPWVLDIVYKYPNSYYTLDANLFDILYDVNNEKEFLAEFRKNYNTILNKDINKWKKNIEKYPDQFLWGTDRASKWHYDQEVGALLEEFSRSFIGQLDPAVQEKFAYKNAEELLQVQGSMPSPGGTPEIPSEGVPSTPSASPDICASFDSMPDCSFVSGAMGKQLCEQCKS